MSKPAGSHFVYPRTKCPDCGKMIADNWFIHHRNTKCQTGQPGRKPMRINKRDVAEVIVDTLIQNRFIVLADDPIERVGGREGAILLVMERMDS
jgi:hypothetical protein